MFTTFLVSATAAGFGAFAGAITAYFLALRKKRALRKEQYLCLLLLIHEQLEPLYLIFSDIPESLIKESDGVKLVTFDIPLPDFPLTSEQIQMLMEVSPDKQMPSTLIQVQHFLKSHSRKVSLHGSDTLSLEFILQQARQLEFMLLSVRTQYEQAANESFPLDYSKSM